MIIVISNLQKYKAFLTVSEYGSFTKAAEVLQYTQSAISRMVQDLETEWNVTLFERKKTGMILTSDGVRLLPHIKNICTSQEKLQMEVDDLNGLISVKELTQYPFLLLEKDKNKVVSDVFQEEERPHIKVTTWDDYAIMSMVERGFGISILPELILRRTPYKIVSRSLEKPVYREIGLVIREYKTASLATKCFMNYLEYRK